MRRLAAALCLALAPLTGAATSFSTDASDLWFNTAEQGWGVNVVQQHDTLFVTIYVYGQDGQPTWYVASEVRASSGGATLPVSYTGALYRTTGPWFGGAFNPAAVNVRQVGAVVFTLDTVNTATLAYTVDGTSVTKALTRQTWKNDTIAGTYLGGTTGAYSGCNGIFDGQHEEAATVTVTQSGLDVTMRVRTDLGECTYTGRYGQGGRMGGLTGSFLCTPSLSGSFSATEVQVNPSGLMALISQEAGACRWSGRIGGLRNGS